MTCPGTPTSDVMPSKTGSAMITSKAALKSELYDALISEAGPRHVGVVTVLAAASHFRSRARHLETPGRGVGECEGGRRQDKVWGSMRARRVRGGQDGCELDGA